MAGEERVPADEQLRFEAIYFGVIGALGIAVLVVRFGVDGPVVGAGLLAALLACILALALSVANRQPRPRRERAQVMLPVVMVLALLTIAGGRVTTGVAAGGLVGLATAPLIGYLAIRRATRA